MESFTTGTEVENSTDASQKNSFTGCGDAANGYGKELDTGYKPAPDFYAMYNADKNSDTEFFMIFKGTLGAIIGAVPGFFFISTLARFGLMASLCGTVLAAGILFGYYLATRRSGFDIKKGGIICILVMLIAVFLAVRISWVHEVQQRIMELRDFMGYSSSEGSSYSSGLDGSSRLILGYDKPTYSNCSDNFSDLISDLRIKGLFIASLVENYVLCAVGAIWLFFKFGKKSY